MASRLKPPTPSRVPENRPSDRLVRPGGRSEKVKHEIVGRVLDRADLLNDDVLLPLELGGVELAVGENVADDVEREPDVASHHPGEIAGALDAGFGVEIAAHIFDRFGDVAGGAPARALERHVFEQVRKPVLVDALVPGARGDEDADRGRLHMRRRVGDDGESGGKDGDLNAHAGALAVWRR